MCTHDHAYINDLITPSPTLESLQGRTNIISAFCIIFGVDMVLKSYVTKWSSTLIATNLHYENTPNIGDWMAQPNYKYQ